MNSSTPPHYRRHTTRPSAGSDAELLPQYSRRANSQPTQREHVVHTFQLTNSKAKPWATLKIQSSAKSSSQLPTFYEREDINATLELNLDKGESVKSVHVQLTGRIITGAGKDDSLTFLTHSIPLWTKDDHAAAKLQGDRVWPICIPFPQKVALPTPSEGTKTFHLPQTFLERHTRASIQYDLTVHLGRSKLRADSYLRTSIAYVPGTKPGPPSFLRQLAYQQNCPLPGPEIDEDGWKTLSPISVSGIVFNLRKTAVICTLSIAKPLIFTRGSAVPCILDISSSDPQALDLLSSPKAVHVQLRRTVRYYQASGSGSGGSWMESVTEIQDAVWWPSHNGRASPCVRRLEGEIHLPKDLQPSSAIAHFTLGYSVAFLPFSSPAFASPSCDSRRDALLEVPIDIATMYARGPKPKAFTPPTYAEGQRKIPSLEEDFRPCADGLVLRSTIGSPLLPGSR